jgi:hypothetical protein
MIHVFRFELRLGLQRWYGNLTYPHPIRYVYSHEEADTSIQE